MLKNILATFWAKVIIAVISLLVLAVSTNHFRDEGFGSISFLLLSFTIVVHLNGFLGGGVIVFLAPRYELGKLIAPSYLWILIISIISPIILHLFHFIPKELLVIIILISFFCSLMFVNLYVLLGYEKIKVYNLISILQSSIFILALVIYIYFLHNTDISVYFYSLLISYVVGFLISFFSISDKIKVSDFCDFKQSIQEMFRLGSQMKVADILQFLNYRLSYFIIEKFLGIAPLGQFSAGTKLSEGVGMVGSSVGTVHYAKVSNSNDSDYNKNLTISLVKFTFITTAVFLIVLLLIPLPVYIKIFGTDFENIKLLLLLLSVGMLSLSCSRVFSSFFSGIGKPIYATIGSLISLVVIALFGYWLIPEYGLETAAIIVSFSYLTMLIYQFFIFHRISGFSLKDFLITKKDFAMIKEIIQGYIR